MATSANEIPAVQPAASGLPLDIPSLHQMIQHMAAKLMAHSQTVSELLNANMQIRAALHLAQTDKAQLEAFVKNLMSPPQAAGQAPAPAVDNGAVTDEHPSLSAQEPVAAADATPV
jgi:hypothetical protein